MSLVDETAEELSTDEVAIIFGFLAPKDIMCARVCRTWRDAAKKTLAPLTEFRVNSVREYNAMRTMSIALPNLQQLSLQFLGHGHKYSDGEDPDEMWAAFTANWATHDIELLSNFGMLEILAIPDAPLNGRYPVLFNFPLLQKLTIWKCLYLKWDLEMLEGLPSLKELFCCNNPHLTGSLSSLIVLKDTLEKVKIIDCRRVEGNFMDLSDFPRLEELDLRYNDVTGDIRDICGHDFPALEHLFLPKGVHGGCEYEIQNVSDVPSFTQAIHRILQRTPALFEKHYPSLSVAVDWRLSVRSLYWYDGEIGSPPPPFRIKFVQVGSRRGWSWYSREPLSNEDKVYSCEINWLDPEPSSDSSGYEIYIEELQRIERRISFYRGFHQPPTEQEYRRLCGVLP
jgi:hypothetical protein